MTSLLKNKPLRVIFPTGYPWPEIPEPRFEYPVKNSGSDRKRQEGVEICQGKDAEYDECEMLQTMLAESSSSTSDYPWTID
jgi:hypothetical protein